MWSNPRIPYQMASERKPLEPPQGRPIIVNMVMNIEYWPFDRPMPRGILPAPHGAAPAPPDVPNFSWVEYGMRCGMPRLMDILARHGIRCSAFINAQVADVYPTLTKAVVDAGWEMVGHGLYQRSLKQVEDEESEIRASLKRLEQLTGKRTRGWFGAAGAETMGTPDLFKAVGLDFIHDWVVDDLPCWMRTTSGPLLALPYSFELNDVPMWVVQGQSSDEFLKRLEATLAVFEREAEKQPRVMSLGLHPHIVGVAHRSYYFEKMLEILRRRNDVIFMTSSEIADWFISADGSNGAAVAAYANGQPETG